MSGCDLSWLTARPIAHRGLHDASKGVIENSISAARAAIAAGFGIECDVQLTADRDLVVFHDDSLDRLTDGVGAVAMRSAKELRGFRLRGGNETIPVFSEFLDAIGGRTPIVVEIKSAFNGDTTPAQRVARALAHYDGPVAIESFDPDQIAFLRARAAALGIAHRLLGIVGEAHYSQQDWPQLSAAQRAGRYVAQRLELYRRAQPRWPASRFWRRFGARTDDAPPSLAHFGHSEGLS